MRKKSLAISNIVMLVAAVFCVAVFGAGAVWAYNANLAMKLPAEFNFSNLTLYLNDDSENPIYSNGNVSDTSKFTIIPVAANTLEISAQYQYFGFTVNGQTQAKTVEVTAIKSQVENQTEYYSISFVKAVAYDVDLGVEDVTKTDNNTFSNDYISYTLGSTLQITLTSAVVPNATDIITFQILFVQAAN